MESVTKHKCVGAHSTSLCDTHTDSDSETSADDADASTNAVVATVSRPAIDSNDCEACLIAQRDKRIALVPCGHRRFCETCANEVERQGRGCPICRTDIQICACVCSDKLRCGVIGYKLT